MGSVRRKAMSATVAEEEDDAGVMTSSCCGSDRKKKVKSKTRLVKYNDLPDYLKDNERVYLGPLPVGMAAAGCAVERFLLAQRNHQHIDVKARLKEMSARILNFFDWHLVGFLIFAGLAVVSFLGKIDELGGFLTSFSRGEDSGPLMTTMKTNGSDFHVSDNTMIFVSSFLSYSSSKLNED